MSMLDSNPHLSIVIPTYNRANFIDYCLEIHVPLAQRHNVQIFISDNASTDNTKEVVDKWKNKYPHIVYRCNAENIGPDGNIELALRYPNTKYVWLLGDTYRIPESGIEYVLNIAQGMTSYDAMVINLGEYITSNAIKTKDYVDQNALLFDLGALMTCLSCLVYSRELIVNANFSRYRNSSFLQTGIIFEYIASRPFVIHWAQSLSIGGLAHASLRKINWSYTHEFLEIACKRWSNFVFSLPVSYGAEIKLKCILDFGKVSKLFILKSLLNLRRLNLLNYRSYKHYSRFLSLTIDYPRLAVLAICVMPISFIQALAIIVILASRKNKLATIRRIIKDKI